MTTLISRDGFIDNDLSSGKINVGQLRLKDSERQGWNLAHSGVIFWNLLKIWKPQIPH